MSNSLDGQAIEYIAQGIKQLAASVPDQIRELRLAAIEGQADFAAALRILPRAEADALIVHARDVAASAKAMN